LSLVCQVIEYLLTVARLSSISSTLKSETKDLELCFKLNDLHFLVEFEVTMNSSHASVEKLIEVNPAFLRSNAHLKNRLFEFTQFLDSVSPVFISSHFHTHRNRHITEEVNKLSFLHLDAVEFVSSSYPTLVEHIKVLSKNLDRVIFSYIVSLELLNNNQDEKVKHDVSNNQYEHNVKSCSKRSTTGFTFNTVWRSINTIVHQFIPIFSSSDSKQ
jgi:hypothetical protein